MEEEEEEEGRRRLRRKSKYGMSNDELHNYFHARLMGGVESHNKGCNCLAILDDANVRASVVKYLCWFKKNQNTNRTRSFLSGSSIHHS
jgi:hypothetical protein